MNTNSDSLQHLEQKRAAMLRQLRGVEAAQLQFAGYQLDELCDLRRDLHDWLTEIDLAQAQWRPDSVASKMRFTPGRWFRRLAALMHEHRATRIQRAAVSNKLRAQE